MFFAAKEAASKAEIEILVYASILVLPNTDRSFYVVWDASAFATGYDLSDCKVRKYFATFQSR
ncbi:hypothetical protein Plhal304r1_c090g0171341 [Plasmopara halstedii]